MFPAEMGLAIRLCVWLHGGAHQLGVTAAAFPKRDPTAQGGILKSRRENLHSLCNLSFLLALDVAAA